EACSATPRIRTPWSSGSPHGTYEWNRRKREDPFIIRNASPCTPPGCSPAVSDTTCHDGLPTRHPRDAAATRRPLPARRANNPSRTGLTLLDRHWEEHRQTFKVIVGS